MHLLVQDTRSLDEQEAAVDLGQTPADMLFLSFSDSDLGAVAAAYAACDTSASLRLASIATLRHPMSVDLYLDRVASRARVIVVRLLGGLEYWRYGAEELAALCRSRSIPLAVLAGDERDDAALAELDTVTAAQRALLDGLFRRGGAANLRQALHYAAHLAGFCDAPGAIVAEVPSSGVHHEMPDALPARAAIVFYRAYLLADDLAAIEALAVALRACGLHVGSLFVASLKDPDCAAFVAERLRAWRPAVVLNATAFAVGHDAAPLRAADVPVLQVVHAGGPREAWVAATRGLSQTDLAMHVVLPELDGHLATGAISFKAPTENDPALQFTRLVHCPDADGIDLAASRAAGWARLAATPRAARRLAFMVSDYPGAGQRGHAVGLDTMASLAAILTWLREAGYAAGDVLTSAALTKALLRGEPTPVVSLTAYRASLARLPAALREAIDAAWGDPSSDPDLRDGWFVLPHLRIGGMVLAVQPGRGGAPKASYHDPDLPPRHAYVAFYLWLREIGIDAMVQLGAHGTLEWLPGKSVALSEACAPRALLGGMPVIYPFIVNNPGEAASAKRRLGAVIIGHLTPPLRAAGLSGEAAEIEALIDEFAAADGLDRRRTRTLREQILCRASECGLLAESGVADRDDSAALARLDAYLCDVKELRIRDGLHVFGTAPAADMRDRLLSALGDDPRVSADRIAASVVAERAALLAALDGRFVAPGPAGAPSRGRADVLPTGRNLFSVDPRAIPHPSAVALAETQLAELLRRHLQDHGDWPRRMVIDLWGSATMRTGGEEFALALLLLGVRPEWDAGSGRVTGFQIVPLAVLDRPRVDVTLRISGLFRDAFEAQVRLFAAAARAVAVLDEAGDWNALAGQGGARIYGPAPGCYGTGIEQAVAEGGAGLGEAYLTASGFAWDGGEARVDRDGFAARVVAADSLLHTQDHAETDLLDSLDVAAHVGGFAAVSGRAVLYHLDTSGAPRARTMTEEIVRVVRGRAANPAWIAGMMRHGYQGAAEIARTLEALAGFASTLPDRFDRQFELLFDATLGDAAVAAFLRAANPAAHAAMARRFADVAARGLWHSRRNDIGGRA